MNAEIVFHQWHRDGEIRAHEIERGIADDRTQQHALSPVVILARDDLRIRQLNFGGWRGAEELEQSSEEAILRCSY